MDNRNNKDFSKEFEKQTSNVKKEDVSKVLNNEAAIIAKAKRGALAKFFKDIKLMLSLLKDYFNGTYTVSWRTIAIIVGTLIYVFSPIDAIPDFIPIAGLIDDAGVVLLALKSLYDVLENYKTFKSSQK